MDVTEPTPHDAVSPDQGETFCQYLAKRLVAKQGFAPGTRAEAREIADQSDHVFTDSSSTVIIGLIDREIHPEKAFTLSAARVRKIAEDCRVSADRAGRGGGEQISIHAIHLMEVGGATPDQPARLGDITPRFLDNIVAAWAIDPQRGTIWTTAGRHGRPLQNFIQELLGRPRENMVAPIAVAPRSFPWLTAAMIAVLAMIFAAEIVFGVGEPDKHKQPTLATLVAFGGLMRSLVIGSGEWYRLFTAPLLHGGYEHIALNAVALGLAGYVLEPLIGRVWLAALFVIGALCGALLSLAFNADNMVAVGASGAGMGLFACMLVLSRRFPSGPARKRLQMNAAYVLAPSLLPLTSTLQGMKVDYAAHFGGAFGGAAMGMALLALWPATDVRPRLRSVATAVALVGLAGFLTAGVLAHRNYPVWELNAAFAPQDQVPTTEDAWRRQSADLAARYPRDPRLQFVHALALMEAGDRAGAEQALRAGLAEHALWQRTITGRPLAEHMHAALALILIDSGRADEAREVAKPGCRLETGNQFRTALDQQKLCTN